MKVFPLLFLSSLLFQQGFLHSQSSSYKEDIKQYRSANWKGLIHDPRTTLKAADSIYLNYYPIREKNKVYCTVEMLKDQEPFDMPTYSGQVKQFIRFAKFSFSLSGTKISLTVYRNLQNISSPLYKDLLFIPFKDAGNGVQTYEGGRYMDVRIGIIHDGHALLDLNRIYNPWCAYSDGYNCPIPPAENHVQVKIKAGEKKFRLPH